MNEIDWSKAPEGATHWDPIDGNYLKQIPGQAFVWQGGGTGWGSKTWQYPDQLSIMPRLVARPMWDGKGLPPVGTVCEYLGAHQYNEWSEVKVFAVWRNLVFVDFIDGWRQESNPERFRPIRTPEQIAAEEREKTAAQICLDAGSPELTAGQMRVAYRLYDAGYRKQA